MESLLKIIKQKCNKKKQTSTVRMYGYPYIWTVLSAFLLNIRERAKNIAHLISSFWLKQIFAEFNKMLCGTC